MLKEINHRLNSKEYNPSTKVQKVNSRNTQSENVFVYSKPEIP